MCDTQMISMAEEIFSVLIYSTKKASASAGNNSGSKYCASCLTSLCHSTQGAVGEGSEFAR